MSHGRPAPGRLDWAGAALVLLGGTAGTLGRELLARGLGEWHRMPLATLAVNLVGAFALGLLLDLLAVRPSPGSRRLRLLLGTGFCGAFTTYSGIVAAPLVLHQPDAWTVAWLASNLLVGCLLAWLGIVVADRFAPGGKGERP